MLSIFPQILWLAPFSSTLLRLGTGISFIYVGYFLISHRNELTKIQLPIIKHPAIWMLMVSGIITEVTGFALLVGYGTQLAAIVAMIITIKHFSLSKRFGSLRPLPRSTYALLFLMCLALLFTGGGPFGLDLPL